MIAAGDAEGYEQEIRRARARTSFRALLISIATAQLLFWSFALGATFGARPLIMPELLSGALFSLGLGTLMSWPSIRRRLDADALASARVREGRKKRRIAVYEDHVVVDQQIILRASIQRVEADADILRLVIAPQTGLIPENRAFVARPDDVTRLREALTASVEHLPTEAQRT